MSKRVTSIEDGPWDRDRYGRRLCGAWLAHRRVCRGLIDETRDRCPSCGAFRGRMLPRVSNTGGEDE